MAHIEIVCFNIESALLAQANGAHRVEFCRDRTVGGITPTLADVKKLRQLLHIPLQIMIRPRAGDFVYTNDDFELMRKTVLQMKEAGADGVVLGILHPDKTVNIHQNEELVALAAPMSCTFHRAFDEVMDMEKALEDIIACGFQTVLTSGSMSNVDKGLDNLKRLVTQAGDRIVIMPGGGVRSANLSQVLRDTRAKYVHSSAIVDQGEVAEAKEIKALLSKLPR